MATFFDAQADTILAEALFTIFGSSNSSTTIITTRGVGQQIDGVAADIACVFCVFKPSFNSTADIRHTFLQHHLILSPPIHFQWLQHSNPYTRCLQDQLSRIKSSKLQSKKYIHTPQLDPINIKVLDIVMTYQSYQVPQFLFNSNKYPCCHLLDTWIVVSYIHKASHHVIYSQFMQ